MKSDNYVISKSSGVSDVSVDENTQAALDEDQDTRSTVQKDLSHQGTWIIACYHAHALNLYE